MSLEEKVGQMFMIWARSGFLNVNGPSTCNCATPMRRFHIGAFGVTVPWDGSLLKKCSPYEMAALTNQLQRDSELPLIFAADFERGVPMRLNGGTVFPQAMALGATHNKNFAFLFGRITGLEARAIGVHWNFFPVADVNSNPLNPIINTRSFGEDVAETGELVAAYIAGARGTGMLTTAKHFPGHGDTETDTHLAVASVSGNAKHLNDVELAPFRAAIAAGVDSIMVAHVTAPALDPQQARGQHFAAHDSRDIAGADGVPRAGGDRRDGHGRADLAVREAAAGECGGAGGSRGGEGRRRYGRGSVGPGEFL